jgi:ribosome-associated protein
MPSDDDRSARQIARGKQRRAGDKSARLAAALMKVPDATIAKLALDEDIRDAIDRARAVTTHIARRRAERTLAGDLRRHDLGELEAALAAATTPAVDVQQFHLAEQWRTRLIAEGAAAIASFPGGGDAELPRMIEAAQRERDTGRPPGAARALFRHITQLLRQSSSSSP